MSLCGRFDPFDNDATKLTLIVDQWFWKAAYGDVGERVQSAGLGQH
jgi:hypothetical protein